MYQVILKSAKKKSPFLKCEYQICFCPFDFILIVQAKEMGRGRGQHPAKGPKLESNPACCHKETALIHGESTLPGELTGYLECENVLVLLGATNLFASLLLS